MEVTLSRKRLDLVLIFSFLATLIIPVYFPYGRLLFFAPALIITYYKKNLIQSLWISLLCGLLMDLLSDNERFGLHTLAYCSTTLLLYKQRQHFFADSLSTLPLMTFFFASLSTLILATLLYTFENRAVYSVKWFFIDLLLLPSLDAIYAFSLFILPPLFMGKRPKKGKDYFMTKA